MSPCVTLKFNVYFRWIKAIRFVCLARRRMRKRRKQEEPPYSYRKSARTHSLKLSQSTPAAWISAPTAKRNTLEASWGVIHPRRSSPEPSSRSKKAFARSGWLPKTQELTVATLALRFLSFSGSWLKSFLRVACFVLAWRILLIFWNIWRWIAITSQVNSQLDSSVLTGNSWNFKSSESLCLSPCTSAIWKWFRSGRHETRVLRGWFRTRGQFLARAVRYFDNFHWSLLIWTNAFVNSQRGGHFHRHGYHLRFPGRNRGGFRGNFESLRQVQVP